MSHRLLAVLLNDYGLVRGGAGVASTATLKRNKPLTNGVELEWVTVSHTPLMEYRLRYRRPSVSREEEKQKRFSHCVRRNY